MRTLALVFCLCILGLAMLLNIFVSNRRYGREARSSVVAGIINILMIISVIYLYNSGDSA